MATEPTQNEALEKLKASLLGEVLLPGTPKYDEARALYNKVWETRKPLYIVRPSGVTDVITTVNFARDNKLPLSVKGGGHNSSGKALVDGGITLDLSLMRGVRVKSHKKEVRVEGGARWRDVDHALAPHGLAMPAGVISSTGVGGLTLGGGWGFLTKQHGLVADNLLSVDIVTADGKLITASDKQNQDLFWAVRGGGGNFGVVTSFKFRVHDVAPKVYGGPQIFPLAKVDEFVKIYNELFPKLPNKAVCFFGFVFPPNSKDVAILCLFFYEGPKSEALPLFKPLMDVGPVADLTKECTFEEMQHCLDPLFPPIRCHWKSGFVKALTSEIIQTSIEQVKKSPSPAAAIVFENYFSEEFAKIPTDQAAWPHRSRNFLCFVNASWLEAEQGPATEEWSSTTYSSLKPHMIGAANNFAMNDEKNVYGSNRERLLQVKEKYDPTNFFHNNPNNLKN